MGESTESGLPSSGPSLMSAADTGASPAAPAPEGGAPAPAAAPAPASSGGRPEGVPEKFWDAEKGAVRVDDVLKSYAHMEKHRGELAEKAVNDKLSELFGKRPEAPDKYEIRVPSKVPEGVVILDKAPGADFVPEEGKAYAVLNPADPLFEKARDLAHKAGLGQDEFDALVGDYLATRATRIPTQAEREAQATQFFDALGENGRDRVRHTWRGLQALVGEQHAKTLDSAIGDTKTFEAIERLVSRATGSPYAPAGTPAMAGSQPTMADVRKIIASPEYQRGDADANRQVREMLVRIHGTGPEAGVPAPFARRA